MNNSTTSEIERWEMPAQSSIQQTSFTPDHVRHRVIHKNGPQHHEQHHGAELHALGERASDQRWRNDRKHELINHERLVRDGGGIVRLRLQSNASQEQMMEVADETRSRSECETVATDRPQHRNESHHCEA